MRHEWSCCMVNRRHKIAGGLLGPLGTNGELPEMAETKINSKSQSEIDAHIGARIREARLLMKGEDGTPMTQTELGNAVGVSFQQIQKYENGTNRIMGSRLWAIASVLNRPISYFFEELDQLEARPDISDSAIVTARMFHELPDGDVKRHVYRLIKSFHSMGSGG